VRLIAEQLSRSFGPRRIFGPLDLAVGPGEVLGVAGSNGSGKTTLLRTLLGLIRPSAGKVWLVSEDGSKRPPRDAPWLLGWAAPDLSLYAELTAAENLEFFARVAGRPADEKSAVARLEALGLPAERATSIPSGSLSTGQRQRLKLAFAALAEPAVLFLDEPTANLDEAGRDVVAALVDAQRSRGATVLASNDPRDLALTDRRVTL
jgi:ABC-type multidrug transport system ATPase subunit